MAVHHGKGGATPGQVAIFSLVIIGLFFGSKFVLETFMEGQNEEAAKWECAQHFDDEAVVDACAEWTYDRFVECNEDPPPEVIEARPEPVDEDGEFDPNAPSTGDVCMMKAVEEFAERRRGVGR